MKISHLIWQFFPVAFKHFSEVLSFTVISFRNREGIRLKLLQQLFSLLSMAESMSMKTRTGHFPKGYIQIMTIHQAKRTWISRSDSRLSRHATPSPKGIDRDLGPYYRRLTLRAGKQDNQFDWMRLHYVAFSRPQKVLVLTAHDQPKDYFAPIWQGLPQWPYVEKDLLAKQRFELREHMPVKKTYSFTGDAQIYETCPRQYQFFREYDFTPSRSP